MRTTVGESRRTSGKHSLLNRMVGREVGIMARSKPSFIERHYTLIDLCAGDGSATSSSEVSSPQIMMHHSLFLKKFNVPHKIILVEKNPNTFSRLEGRGFDAELINCDAREIKEFPVSVCSQSAAFIHADPNTVNDWPLSKELLQNSPEYTTLLATLGCNVGGLKRLPLKERKAWFRRMDDLLEWLPERHDALLVALRGDSAQWAYLIIGPRVWFGEGNKSNYINDTNAAFGYWQHGIDMIRFREDTEGFYDTRSALFLTVKEWKEFAKRQDKFRKSYKAV